MFIIQGRQLFNNSYMIEKSAKDYLDNETAQQSAFFLPNQLAINIQDQKHPFERAQVKVFSWCKVRQLKEKITSISKYKHLANSQIRLFYKNIELTDNQMGLSQYKIHNNSFLFLSQKQQIYKNIRAIKPFELFNGENRKVIDFLDKSTQAIISGAVSSILQKGTSGVYIIKNSINQNVSIFKPFDEQANAPNNPKNNVGSLGSEGLLKGVLSGQSATRQVAAYLIDESSNYFHKIPITTYVEFCHEIFNKRETILGQENRGKRGFKLGETKLGSLQQFIQNVGIIGDFGWKKFSAKQVRKIGILDIRILNSDRNEENILVRNIGKDYQLIPIDHGLSFPDTFELYEGSVEWMKSPQIKQPFSAEEKEFISLINPEKDTEILRKKLAFRQICLRNFKIAQIFLKKCVSMGLTLYQIGKLLYRSGDKDDEVEQKDKRSKKSKIESLVIQAEGLYLSTLESIEKENFFSGNGDIFQSLDQNSQGWGSDQAQEDLSGGSQNLPSVENLRNSFGKTSAGTCQSLKSLLSLRKKVSLPQMKKKNTSYHQLRQKARKERQGVNGTSKTIWDKYNKQQWNELFFYYFQNLLETTLLEKQVGKTTHTLQKSGSVK